MNKRGQGDKLGVIKRSVVLSTCVLHCRCLFRPLHGVVEKLMMKKRFHQCCVETKHVGVPHLRCWEGGLPRGKSLCHNSEWIQMKRVAWIVLKVSQPYLTNILTQKTTIFAQMSINSIQEAEMEQTDRFFQKIWFFRLFENGKSWGITIISTQKTKNTTQTTNNLKLTVNG